MRTIETTAGTEELVTHIRDIARPLRDDEDLDPLMHRIGDARFVLLGEATHGTSEFYSWRARLTKRLLGEKGFSFVAVEGDWPHCYQVNRYVKGDPAAGRTASQVLRMFDRWPTWIWANQEMVSFVEWLRRYNRQVPRGMEAGFYGLDTYSLWESLRAVVEYLAQVDPAAAEVARQAHHCFQPYGDVRDYSMATRLVPESCEDEVVALLKEILMRRPEIPGQDPEALFNAEQNAWVVRDAERYYRAFISAGPEAWNIRDRHMADTLDRLMEFHGPGAKAIIWAHNSHIGDARASEMADRGMVNLGQLVRERHVDQGVISVGFSTHRGSVVAADAWEAPMEFMVMPPAREGSWEDVIHRAGAEDKLLLLDEGTPPEAMRAQRGHRAVGVVYDPKHEGFTNYVPSVLPERYDAFLYFDETEALHPLHLPARAAPAMPETYPAGV